MVIGLWGRRGDYWHRRATASRGGWVGLACAALLVSQSSLYAVPACPAPATVSQPDGSVVTIHLRGDERLHWHEDTRGYAVARDPKTRQWVYAREDDGRLVATDHVVGKADPKAAGLAKPNVMRMAARSADRQGREAVVKQPSQAMSSAGGGVTLKNLVILVNFSDLTVAYPREDYDDLFNVVGYSEDGAVGSVKDYYLEVSYGIATVESTVVEPVTLDHGYAYYGANNEDGDDVNPQAMVQEAVQKLDDRGFDFSTMDADENGRIDGLTIIHAGGGEEYGGNDPDYIWSHMSIIGYPVEYDGVTIVIYHTEPARRGWDSSPSSWGLTRIGVVCHEMGHFFGLPDLYDYGGDSRGAGRFCIMATGSWNGDYGTTPAHMSAWCKSKAKVLTPMVIDSPGSYTLAQAETTPQAYKLQGPFNAKEYFLIENRQGVGFDAAMPGSSRGILIWHVDERQPDNDDQTHYKVDLEEASGTQHLELNTNSGQDSDYYRLGNVTSFTYATVPNSLSYAGQLLGMNVTNVGATGSTMSFDVTGPFALTVGAVNDFMGQIQYAPEPNDANAPVYGAGAEVTLTAVPDADPERFFSHWEIYDPNHPGDANYVVTDTNESTTVLMDADRELTAVFRCSDNGVEMAMPPLALALMVFFRRRSR